MTQPKKILIVRTDRIGDVVLSLPMASFIKRRYPGCKVTFMLREYTKPLAESNPDIDEIILLKENKGRVSITGNAALVKSGYYDTCIAVYPTFRIALFLFLSGIKNRIGTGYRLYSFLFNKKIYEHRKHGKHHELEHNINMLKMIGIEERPTPQSVPFNIHSNEKSRHIIENEFDSKKINTPLQTVIIHPGSGGSSIDWPLSSFQELIKLMARELNINILITGGKHEFEMCNRLVVHKKIENFAGRFDLNELIALIDKSDLLIANSTGPIHIAAALGKHVIGFYPKIKECAQKRWGPYTYRKIIFEPTVCNGNCKKETCEKLNCMNSINVRDVFEKIKQILNDNLPEN